MQRSLTQTIVARIFGHGHDCRGAAVRAETLRGLLRSCLSLGSVWRRSKPVVGYAAATWLDPTMLAAVPLAPAVPSSVSLQVRLVAHALRARRQLSRGVMRCCGGVPLRWVVAAGVSSGESAMAIRRLLLASRQIHEPGAIPDSERNP